MLDFKPEDCGELSEEEKQAIFAERLEHLYENFISEYDVTQPSVIGVLHQFTTSLELSYQDEEYED